MKPETDQRLSDHISLGVLTRVFPPELVDRVVAEAGRTELRVAVGADTDPDRLSFTRTLRAARRSTGSHPGFRPQHP